MKTDATTCKWCGWKCRLRCDAINSVAFMTISGAAQETKTTLSVAKRRTHRCGNGLMMPPFSFFLSLEGAE
jgi:hypothetical protein